MSDWDATVDKDDERKLQWMGRISEICKAAEELCKKVCIWRDGSHDYEHSERVAKNVHRIGNREFLPRELILLTQTLAWLHDVDDKKYCGNSEKGCRVEEFLMWHFPIDVARKLVDSIDRVSFSGGEKTYASGLEQDPGFLKIADILQDADRLDAIGPVGVARVFAYAGAKSQSLFGKEKSARSHFDEKLLKLHKLMKTKAGKDLGAMLTRTMEVFVEGLDKQLAQNEY